MAERIDITVDGRGYQVEEGANLVEALREQGLEIPTLCYYPHIQPPLGTCRVCLVEIDGRTACACEARTRAGQQIALARADLADRRKATVELMFAEGNHFCPACEKSGDCDLQGLGYQLGMQTSRFPHLFIDRLTDYRSRRLVIVPNRCVLCQRCVKEIRTPGGQAVFSLRGRGEHTRIRIDAEQEALLDEATAVQAMQICPTGAILLRGQSEARPAGERQYDVPTEHLQPGRMAEWLRQHFPGRKWRIATTSLAGCFGCHMSMLDIDTELAEILEFVQLDRSPLTDLKTISAPCDIGFIEGGCGTDENVEVLRSFREQCRVLIAVGECAIWGGLPAMRNLVPLGECLEEAYRTESGEAVVIPHSEDIPALLDRVYACSEVVHIDYYIPGCPPSADLIWSVIAEILTGKPLSLTGKTFRYD